MNEPTILHGDGPSSLYRLPSSVAAPLLAGSNPSRMCSNVVFPAPFGPISAVTLPCSARNDTSSNACLPPYVFDKPEISIITAPLFYSESTTPNMVRLRRARDIVSSNRMTTGFHPAVGMATMSGMRHDDMVGVSARAIRIGVLDNDPFALDAMCAMISAVSKDFRVMWSTGSPAVAIEHCHNPHTRPEVLVLDMALGGITGADVCRRIRRRTGGTGIVCVTSYSVDVYQREAIASGAQGLFAKERLRTDIAVAIRWAAQGLPADEQAAVGFRDAQTAYGLLSGTVPAKMSVDMRDPLSLREKEILRLYARRLTTDEIAGRRHPPP